MFLCDQGDVTDVTSHLDARYRFSHLMWKNVARATRPLPSSTMFLFDLIHRILDWLLAQVRLVQNREIGWRCLDRKTGRYKRERQPILKKVKLWVLFSRPMEWIDRTRLMR